MMIIIHSPSIHNILRLSPAKEQLAVEAFVAQFAIEALDVAILPRTARRNESRFYTTRPQPLFHGFAHELRPIVTPQAPRPAAQREQFLQRFDDIFACVMPPDFDSQTLPRELVHHRQYPHSPATMRAFGHEVIAPNVVLAESFTTIACIEAEAATPAFTGFSANLQALRLPQTMHAFVVHAPAFAAKQCRDATVTEPWPLQRKVMHVVNQTALLIRDFRTVALCGSSLAEGSADPTF